ncbi:hypothetical protein [Aquimarina sp. 2201CG5-10]|uniref:hypothetical protein n=1 Tax=Aquimarina callyspongiae TaxID=3098150 RepID=UPI002AB4EFD2|nr:hypothetical protein [Aquimarina sp. 2201CG5-10]MDY8135019.1 hypothetical protein [Aquimarina sp. 2201CG5-10]
MKRLAFLIFSLLTLISCDSDDRVNNSFLPNVAVNFEINLNLPEYDNLDFPGGHFVETTAGRGIRGVILYNVNDQQFTAFELSDPNHSPSSCSSQSVDGIISTCNCNDGNSYNIVTGQQTAGEGQFGLKSYRVQKQGNTLFISN